MPDDQPDRIIHADPSKTFFIEMLTRDISLQECILDLTDNSIHNLITEFDLDVMNILLGRAPAKDDVRAVVKISFSVTEFRIEDTCGGITIEDARDEVFRFGNPKRANEQQTGLGVYGIGMKRAFFKLGKVIAVESNTKDEEFRVDIDVNQWEEKKSWDLEFTYARESAHQNGNKPGTKIIVRELNPAVGKHLSLEAFQSDLIKKLGAAYALFLRTGLELKVNERPVKPLLPELLTSGDLKPVRQLLKVDGVDVLILAGITPREDKAPQGWYIFCNGRMVVEADKTELTGWGENKFPQFHSKYNHFIGMAYFRSKNVGLLPWTTTKDGVEKESPIYQRTLGHMRVLAKPVVEFLNRLYPQDKPMEERPEFEVLESAKKISLERLAKTENTSFVARAPMPSASDQVRISYTRRLSDVDRVRNALGRPRMSYKETGERTFDYFLRKECP